MPKDELIDALPETPEGWTKRMVCHLNFGREGGSASYDVFDAEGRKVPFGWGYDSRKGGGRGFYVPHRDGYLTWDEVREHYAALRATERDGKQMTPQVIRRELKRHGSDMGVEVVPHGLRKNAVNSLLEAGCSVPEVAAITGQDFRMVQHYAAGVDRRRLGKAAILKLETKRTKRDKSA